MRQIVGSKAERVKSKVGSNQSPIYGSQGLGNDWLSQAEGLLISLSGCGNEAVGLKRKLWSLAWA